MFTVAKYFITCAPTVRTNSNLFHFLPYRVVIRVAISFLMRLRIFRYFFRIIRQIRRRMVAEYISTSHVVAHLFRHRMERGVRRTLRRTGAILYFAVELPSSESILAPSATLVVEVTRLMPTHHITRNGDRMTPFAWFVVSLPTRRTTSIPISSAKVGMQR